jgi:KTSC domain
MKVQRKNVSSTSLASIGYDPETSTLEVEFLNGHLYQYFGVPPQAYSALMSASSLGAYVARVVKPTYRCIQIA